MEAAVAAGAAGVANTADGQSFQEVDLSEPPAAARQPRRFAPLTCACFTSQLQ